LRQGFRLRALARSPQQAGYLAAQGVQLVAGDLHRPGALRQLVNDCAGIIHAAGAVRGASQADFDRINVEGTANLLSAVASHAPAARLLMLSSLAAREPRLSWYAASKRGGELLLEQAPQLDWVIMRPPAVYGPGDKEMLPVFQWMSRGIALVPGDPAARISLIHVSDLVTAITACLGSAACRHQTLALCDGKPGGYDWREMAAIAGAIWGRKVRLWRVPAWLLDSVARVNILGARITGATPMLTPAKLRELRHCDWVADNAAITARTAWQPRTDLRLGLQQLRKAEL
jgi:nucleoside-diphosphate-sugar epimerase